MTPTRAAHALLLLAGWIACAHGELPAADPLAECRPTFPYADGWLGGDAAFSVALPRDPGVERSATLWLFGDSFVAESEQRDRVGAHFIHNSIALSRCGERGFEISYHWRSNERGEPRAFFDSGNESPYWWLFDGFVHAGTLYVGLLEVSAAPPEEVLQLPFRLTGMKLARISNPLAPPREWEIEISTLSRSRRAFPGASMQVYGEYVYFFSFSELREGRQPRFLSRLALADLEAFPPDLSPGLETLVDTGQWQAGFRPQRARILMHDNASEMSVEFHPKLGQWLAVYGSPVQAPAQQDDEGSSAATGGRPSDRVYVRTADRLEGPWSEREILFRIPELQPDHPASRDLGTVCYAAKEHAAFSPPGQLFVTYVCNLRTRRGEDPWAVLQRLEKRMDIYRPRSLLLPLPKSITAR